MPEYLAPGVYIEETSFRSRTIEGVATSTTGFAGVTHYGPVQYPGGPTSTEPRLITSFTEFERVYGGLERFFVGGVERESYVAHAARAFFMNGGTRLYVSRVFGSTTDAAGNDDFGLAGSNDLGDGTDPTFWRGRWPGSFGNALVTVTAVRRGNVAVDLGGTIGVQARGLTRGAVVEVTDGGTPPASSQPLDIDALATIAYDSAVTDDAGRPVQIFVNAGGGAVSLSSAAIVKEIVLTVAVAPVGGAESVYEGLATHPAQRRWIGKILEEQDPEDEDAIVYLDTSAPDDPANPATAGRAVALMGWLIAAGPVRMTGGNDGAMPTPAQLAGSEGDPDDASRKATGLEALGEVEDIAIVALPDSGTYDDPAQRIAATDALITHAQKSQYRIAVVDGPRGSSMNEVREFRGKFDSKYAALYHPWIEILDPTERPSQGAPPRRILLPPSGFVTGIYGRNDITRGVWKAPANEVVRGLTKFEMNINKGRNDVLNPEGINALRFFEGRGNRVWGARTMSSDPEWKYVNVRRFFAYLERSIDLAMQWAVFEPNNERLWNNIRQTVEDFLYVQWINGALLGTTPDEAYFVRCDRTTMTQNDLDNGRLICLVGVAPTKPAEFVIFRIGQWTADAQI